LEKGKGTPRVDCSSLAVSLQVTNRKPSGRLVYMYIFPPSLQLLSMPESIIIFG